jgi:hypothetical protein
MCRTPSYDPTDRKPQQQVRRLSHSEIDTAMTCWARWDFQYGGHLAGATLKSKELAPILGEGRAWGAAVATWHQHAGELTALFEAHQAMRASLDKDAAAMPFLTPEERVRTEARLGAMLDHYAATAVPLQDLSRLEEEFEVPIPSRSGRQGSSRYRFQGYIDGWQNDGPWIVEFKLRKRLTDAPLLERQRQTRWYAWAYGQKKGQMPVGVIIDERLNEAPKPARLTEKGKKPSHTKEQLTTPELYTDLCHEFDVTPKPEVVMALSQRQWQHRFPILFREGELEEAGRELVSAAKLIRDLDAGDLAPVRHASRMNCQGCRYERICSNPTDELHVDSLFNRTVPKRLRRKEDRNGR